MNKVVIIPDSVYENYSRRLAELAHDAMNFEKDVVYVSFLEESFESGGEEYTCELAGRFDIYSDIEDLPEGTFNVLKYLAPTHYSFTCYDSNGEKVNDDFKIGAIDIVRA